jgi:hypothetical protein
VTVVGVYVVGVVVVVGATVVVGSIVVDVVGVTVELELLPQAIKHNNDNAKIICFFIFSSFQILCL